MTENAKKCQSEFENLSRLSIGELLDKKFTIDRSNDYSQFIINLEFERRSFKRDAKTDRIIAALSLILSVAAIIISVFASHH